MAIYPAVPTIDDNLTANFISEDVDGDILAMSIQWYKNEVIELSYTEETLPSSATACNEEWYAVVTPNDGLVDGQAYTSNKVVICEIILTCMDLDPASIN